MGLIARFESVMAGQRGALFGWVPVCLAIGVGLYFALPVEPSILALCTAAAALIGAGVVAPRIGEGARPLFIAGVLILAGGVIAAGRAHHVAGPVLEFRYYGAIEGRVVAVDRSQSDALRLTLDRVRLDRVTPDRTPARVRISLHGDRSQDARAEPGSAIMITGHLSPPSGPVEPGGFDFQRHAWFARLGAVGYARSPLMAAGGSVDGMRVGRVRAAASQRITTALPGDIGGFASAITTGDRSAISQDALEDLRASNLAHLLAISGLHMGLMSGVVFAALRLLLAAIPRVALRWPTRAIAAGGALIVAAGYLALSGGNVATQRAFIMVAVALCALMIGRRAISLRAVAIAAVIVLILRPETLFSPGFQMSFAATTALVAVFGLIRDRGWRLGPAWIQPAVAVFISSAVAGLATAPVAAAHFNAIAQYGLIANLASVPLMGVLVMPAALLAAVLSPLGLEWIGLEIMGLGLRWILFVAGLVADLPDGRRFVPSPDPLVLPLFALGSLLLMLWVGRMRWAGGVVVAASFVLWAQTDRPDLLIDAEGKLVGLMTPEGRALSRDRAGGFVARNWLENDGERIAQDVAAARWQAPPGVAHLTGKRAAAAFVGCRAGELVISNTVLEAQDLPCHAHDPKRLRTTGAVAYRLGPDKKWILHATARGAAGERLWTRWEGQRKTQRLTFTALRERFLGAGAPTGQIALRNNTGEP
ncbi:ComEC/Rec2 family competence protein [Sulfitobacter albidus]|uniref:ComEC/Rec2 family competence protein n=1 Tax=Sulfitobacter albidus TaxID=2829501 RepID=A0A975JG60_9RHOB|nr:ComEC/Rec2 family competence protein [Sulfitobacter albidus]QUJ77848.1 ComEC/Rec2 family competence protein [Sulfitobacter albidus]